MTGASIRRLASLSVMRFPPPLPEGIWLRPQTNPSVKTSPFNVRLQRLYRSSTFTGMLMLNEKDSIILCSRHTITVTTV